MFEITTQKSPLKGIRVWTNTRSSRRRSSRSSRSGRNKRSRTRTTTPYAPGRTPDELLILSVSGGRPSTLMTAAWIAAAMKTGKAKIISSMFDKIRFCGCASIHIGQENSVHVRPYTVLRFCEHLYWPRSFRPCSTLYRFACIHIGRDNFVHVRPNTVALCVYILDHVKIQGFNL